MSSPRQVVPRVLVVLPAAAALASVAQDLGCDDLSSRGAAQTRYDSNRNLWADALDPDGNGAACDHDDHREPRRSLNDAAVDAYLEAVSDHASDLYFNVNPLLGIVQEVDLGTVSERDEEQAAEIVAVFAGAPAVTAALTVPAGYDHLQAVYAEATATYAAVADAFDAWSQTRPGATANATAMQDLTDRVAAVSSLTSDLFTLLDAEGL